MLPLWRFLTGSPQRRCWSVGVEGAGLRGRDRLAVVVGGAVSADTAAEYLAAYVEAYRLEHGRLTQPAPGGAGFPEVVESPYLSAAVITCLVASDGAAVVDSSQEPQHEWWIAGGPA